MHARHSKAAGQAFGALPKGSNSRTKSPSHTHALRLTNADADEFERRCFLAQMKIYAGKLFFVMFCHRIFDIQASFA